MVSILRILVDPPCDGRWPSCPSFWSWVTISWMLGEHPWNVGWLSLEWWLTIHGSWHLSLGLLWFKSIGAKFQVCSTLPSVRFWMVGDIPWSGGWPFWGWWLIIHGSCHLILILPVKSGFKFLVFSILNSGIFWMVGDNPGFGGLPSKGLHLVLILWV